MSQDHFMGVVLEGKYRLDRKIGEGGMGAVYLGVQLMVDRPVAIKLLHAGLSAHERVKKRFEVEAKAIGRLSHPNVITLYDFGHSREIDAFYMVMEFLDGEAMHKRVVHGVAAEEAIRITRQISAALDHAHHLKILHRDLKPENIIIVRMTDGSDLVKVLDFGIARIFKDDDDETKTQAEKNRLTRAGEVFGTPAYISPEQARGERDLTPASDLYSLGVMLFEMLEGRLPFWGETAIDTIMLHIAAPIPVITRADVPESLKQLTYSLLDKEPGGRPQTGRALIAALDAIDTTPGAPVPQAWSDATMTGPLPIMGLAEQTTGPMDALPAAMAAADASGSMTDRILPASATLAAPSDPARSEITLSRIKSEEPGSSNNQTLALIVLMCVAILGALALGVVAMISDEGQVAELDTKGESTVVEAIADDEPDPDPVAERAVEGAVGDDVVLVGAAPDASGGADDEAEGTKDDDNGAGGVGEEKKPARVKAKKTKKASAKPKPEPEPEPKADEKKLGRPARLDKGSIDEDAKRRPGRLNAGPL